MVLTFASVLLAYEKTQRHRGWHIGFLWAILSGICFAVSLVIAKYFYNHYSFLTGLIWTRGTGGLYAVILLLFPSVRHVLSKKSRQPFKTYGKRHAFGIVHVN
jgi:drug/metabolite transporter (DMT)-like permease